jgi:hypothetical protein
METLKIPIDTIKDEDPTLLPIVQIGVTDEKDQKTGSIDMYSNGTVDLVMPNGDTWRLSLSRVWGSILNKEFT